LVRNRERDGLVQAALKQQGWGALTIWECELERDGLRILNKLRRFLDNAIHE
jgi:G:T-mismatch repair DNA endonuclease (very short patch repair protein)